MSEITLSAAEITPAFVARQLALQGITLAEPDLAETTHHFQLLLSHATRVMALPLPEAIEPAPEFRPSAEGV